MGVVADFLYASLTSHPTPQRTSAHPMLYLVSRPEGHAEPRAIVIAIDGSDRQFYRFHAAFVRARRDLPFVLVTPFVLSNGGHPSRSAYPYSDAVFEAAEADPLQFDTAGVIAIITDMQTRFNPTLPVYLTGFSAGAHLAWSFLLTHPDRLAGAAMASANFAGRGVAAEVSSRVTDGVPVRGFVGKADPRFDVLSEQWHAARTLALKRGHRDLDRVVVPGAGHSPFPREVLSYFAGLALIDHSRP
jgi:dienelactone hydrolase